MNLRKIITDHNLESVEFVFYKGEDGQGFSISQVIALDRRGRVPVQHFFALDHLCDKVAEIISAISAKTGATQQEFGCGVLVIVKGDGAGSHDIYARYEFHPLKFDEQGPKKLPAVNIYLDDVDRERLLDVEISEVSIA